VRRLYEMFMEASTAHARWDYETSLSIIKNRRKLLILLIFALPVIAGPVYSYAAGGLPEILGGKHAYAPAFYDPTIFFVSIAIGLCAGLITGCIGAGGGFIITPALMSAGIRGILAVGTDLFHIFAKAIMGTTVHKKLGNVSVGLAIAFVIGSLIGVSGGGVLNRALYESNPVLSDLFISVVYVVLLGFLGFYALIDFFRARKKDKIAGQPAHAETAATAVAGGTLPGLPGRLQSVNIPPTIKFDEDVVEGGRKIPAVFVAGCGSIVGFVAAIMGVGGGFLTFPMFVYGLGVSSFTTVGTDIFQIILTAGFASISQYAIYGYIFYTLAIGMLLGSLLGIQIGALTTKVVKGVYIRGFYAVAILAGFINRLFVLPDKLSSMGVISISPGLGKVLAQVGNWLFFLIVGIFAFWVISTFIRNLPKLRGETEL